jgi:hypothetical protein
MCSSLNTQSQNQARICKAQPGMHLALRRCVANPRPKSLSVETMTSASTRPVCDEWGLYDPQQAGFEAIVRRLLPNEDDEHAVATSLPLNSSLSARQP